MNFLLRKKDIAACFGVSVTAVDNWITAGCPVAQRNAAGHVQAMDIREVIEWREGRREGGEGFDLNTERARLAHHQANIAKLDEETKKRTLIPEGLVKSKWQEMLGNMRARLLVVPPQLGATCANLSSEAVEKKASELVRQALEELADDPEY